MNRRPKRVNKFSRIVRALRASDPDIIEIVQFGSSVYAPRLARDLDLIVTTRAKKDENVYWDAVEDFPKGVDLLIREPGQKMGSSIALSAYAFGKSLYGKGATRKEAERFLDVANQTEPHMLVTFADENLKSARQEREPFIRDRYYRIAFDTLFQATRSAVMIYLITKKSQAKIPASYSKKFREFITMLHLQFGDAGNYPKDRVDDEFMNWRAKVSAFIEELAARAQSSSHE